VLVTTVDGRLEVLAVLEDRTNATLVGFLASMPKRVGRRIRQVCIDIYVGYERAVKEQL
jgi:transposase